MKSSSKRSFGPQTAAELYKQIEFEHENYLNSEDDDKKNEALRLMKGYITEYLYLVPQDRKFKHEATSRVLKQSIQTHKLNFDPREASLAFEYLAAYAHNLLEQPWRNDFFTIKLTSGYYVHNINAYLTNAHEILIAMSYVNIDDLTLKFVHQPGNKIPQKELKDVSRDCFVASQECIILSHIQERVYSQEPSFFLSIEDVYQNRELFLGDVESISKRILLEMRQMKHKLALEQAQNPSEKYKEYCKVGRLVDIHQEELNNDQVDQITDRHPRSLEFPEKDIIEKIHQNTRNFQETYDEDHIYDPVYNGDGHSPKSPNGAFSFNNNKKDSLDAFEKKRGSKTIIPKTVTQLFKNKLGSSSSSSGSSKSFTNGYNAGERGTSKHAMDFNTQSGPNPPRHLKAQALTRKKLDEDELKIEDMTFEDVQTLESRSRKAIYNNIGPSAFSEADQTFAEALEYKNLIEGTRPNRGNWDFQSFQSDKYSSDFSEREIDKQSSASSEASVPASGTSSMWGYANSNITSVTDQFALGGNSYDHSSGGHQHHHYNTHPARPDALKPHETYGHQYDYYTQRVGNPHEAEKGLEAHESRDQHQGRNQRHERRKSTGSSPKEVKPLETNLDSLDTLWYQQNLMADNNEGKEEAIEYVGFSGGVYKNHNFSSDMKEKDRPTRHSKEMSLSVAESKRGQKTSPILHPQQQQEQIFSTDEQYFRLSSTAYGDMQENSKRQGFSDRAKGERKERESNLYHRVQPRTTEVWNETRKGVKVADESEDPSLMKKMKPWECPHCTFHNEKAENVCEMCHKSNDFVLEPQMDVVRKIELESIPKLKKEEEISFINTDGPRRRIHTGEKEKIKVSEPPEELQEDKTNYVSCPFCTFLNPPSKIKCEICETRIKNR